MQPPPQGDASTSAGYFMHANGSFTAFLITATATTIGVLLWLTYRFVKHRQRQQLQVGKKKTKESIAAQVVNAVVRAKGVAVWLKAIRYVQNGITDDRLFKQAAGNSRKQYASSHHNPFLVDEESTQDSDAPPTPHGAHGNTNAAASNLAIIICVDAPSEPNALPPPSVHADAERLTHMFESLAYFGGAYKTATFTTRTVSPTSANLAELLLQLAAARRAWTQVVVYISAPARAFPKDFLDASVFRNANADLSMVEKFSRPVKMCSPTSNDDDADAYVPSPSSSREGMPFAGCAGLEFLALPNRPKDPSSWIDVALFLDRLRDAVKRRDDDTPLLLLFDPIIPPVVSSDGELHRRRHNGVAQSIAWMHVDRLPVSFGETEDGSDEPEKPLVMTAAELSKFEPDATLLNALDDMDLEELIRQSLGVYEHLSATVICAENSTRTTPKPGEKKGAAVSQFCQALLAAHRDQTAFDARRALGTLQPHGAPWTMDAAEFDILHTAAPPGILRVPHEGDVSRVPTSTDAPWSSPQSAVLTSSAYHAGAMTSETVALYLAHHHDFSDAPSPPRTFVVHTCGKVALVPSGLYPVPLATQVMMMPRPVHCRVPPALAHLAEWIFAAVEEVASHLWMSTDAPAEQNTVTVMVCPAASPCGSTLFAKRLVWEPRMLQTYTSGVVYVDMRDFRLIDNSKEEEEGASHWFVHVLGYMCRLVGITVQISTLKEALGVWRQVWCHSEAKYFVVLDHVSSTRRVVEVLCGVGDGRLGGNGGGTRMLLIPDDERVDEPASSAVHRIHIPSLVEWSPVSSSKQSHHTPCCDAENPWPQQLALALLGNCGVHRKSGCTWTTMLPLVTSFLGNLFAESVSSLDVLPMAAYFVKRGALAHHRSLTHGEGSVVMDASASWTMMEEMGFAELVANTEQLIFDGASRVPIIAPPVDKRRKKSEGDGSRHKPIDDASMIVLDRLVTLQSILLAPAMFPFQDHPQRTSLHRARLIAIMFGRITAHRFSLAVQEMVALGVVLAEFTSFGSDATSQGTLLEDAHAAMVDACVMLRVNRAFCHRMDALLRVDLSDAHESSLHLTCFEDLLRSPSGSSEKRIGKTSEHDDICNAHRIEPCDPPELLSRARLALLSALLPFMNPSRRSETRNQGVYLEWLALFAALHGPATSSIAPELVTTLCSAIPFKVCSPWYLHACLEQCSVGRLCAVLLDVRSALQQMEMVWAHRCTRSVGAAGDCTGDKVEAEVATESRPGVLLVDVSLIHAAEACISRIANLLQSNRCSLHRNPLELWTVLYLCAAADDGGEHQLPYFKLEKQQQQQDVCDEAVPLGCSAVLAIEPGHNATVAMVDAFDGAMLFASSILSNIDFGQEGLTASASITALLFVARGVLAVGFSTGAVAIVLQPKINRKEAHVGECASDDDHRQLEQAWIVHMLVGGDGSGHSGAPISELFVVRNHHRVEPDVPAAVPTPMELSLISCAKQNHTIRRWPLQMITQHAPSTNATVETAAGSSTERVAIAAFSEDATTLAGGPPPVVTPADSHATSLAASALQFLRKHQVMFPSCGEYGISTQHEVASLHHFFATIVRAAVHPTVVGALQFGRDCRQSFEEDVYQSEEVHPAASSVLLQYGLPDLCRGGRYNESSGDSALNSIAISHGTGLSLCSGSISTPQIPAGAELAQCGMDRRGHLVLAVARGPTLILFQVVKETGF